MGAAYKFEIVSEQDYLEGELVSEVKHEYLAGTVYAMAGARNRHNSIAVNCTSSLHSRLRGSPCRPFNSDTKVRIRLVTGTRYYYPDAMVVCSPNPEDDSFQDSPAVILEVLSDQTRRTDEGEKKDAYFVVPTLGVYLLVEQDVARVVAHRRTDGGFEREVYEGLDAVVSLPEIGTSLPLSEIYEDIVFSGPE